MWIFLPEVNNSRICVRPVRRLQNNDLIVTEIPIAMADPYNLRMNRHQFSEPKHPYGLDFSSGVRSDLRSQTRSQARKDVSQPHSDMPPLGSSSRLRLARSRDLESSSTERLNQQVQFSYKQHIQQLISQNETLKLQQRQAQVRADELQHRLAKLEEGSRALVAEPQPKSLIRYQLPVRKALEGLGLLREEATPHQCTSQAQIIEFLLDALANRTGLMKQVQRDARERVAEEQKELGKVRQSLKKLMQTNDLFRNRENRYKQKMEEMRKEWNKTCEQLTKRNKELQRVELEKQAIQKLNQQQDMEIARLQREIRSNIQMHKSSSEHMETELYTAKNSMRDLQLENQELRHLYQEAQQTIANCSIKQKLQEEELARAHRDSIRWKERYEQLDKQIALEKKSIPEPPKRLAQETWRYPLQPIPETNSSIEFSSTDPQIHTRITTEPPQVNSSILTETHRSRQSTGPPVSDLELQVTELYKAVLMEVEERNKFAEKL